MTTLAPGSILMIGALLVPFLPSKLRKLLFVALPIASLAHLLSLPVELSASLPLFGMNLEFVRIDALSRVFGIVFHIAAILCTIYGLHVNDRVEQGATLCYAGGAIAATFAGDLVTLFLFWELTAITSVFLIWVKRTERSYRVGLRYLIIQVASGVLLLAGAILYHHETGSLRFELMELGSLGTWLIFLSFGIKAAFPFLHNWLQDAYPEATVSGTVVLASFTTKLAIYALARGFAGTDLLIPIGAAMTAFPIFFAVIENDLRRVLAYSLNNQLGYMVVGIGIGTELALNGAAAHAFAHILYKGLLFMSMGAVLHRTGTIKANELGGLVNSMPITCAFCIIGAMAISAVPGLSGFTTKSMILTATGDAHLTFIFAVLLFASAGVCDHSGIKIPFFTFFAHDGGWRVKEAPLHMLIAMGIAAAFCIGIGVYPDPLYALLPYEVTYNAYDATHVITMLQLLAFAGLAFAVMMRAGVYPPELPAINLDFDWVYRRLLPRFVRESGSLLGSTWRVLWGAIAGTREGARDIARVQFSPPRGFLGEPWTAGATSLWAAVILGLSLLIYYL